MTHNLIGDMFALPFDDQSFDVVTSFRGIWGNCLEALREARRVVRPGGKVGLSFWGHQRQMQAYPLFVVLGQTPQEERDNTGAMVRIGRPGVAEQLMVEAGLEPGTRTSLRLHWEFVDVELAARARAATGLAYLAIQHLGEEAFLLSANGHYCAYPCGDGATAGNGRLLPGRDSGEGQGAVSP